MTRCMTYRTPSVIIYHSFKNYLAEERFRCLKAWECWNHLQQLKWAFPVSVNASEVLSSPSGPARWMSLRLRSGIVNGFQFRKRVRECGGYLMNEEELWRYICGSIDLLFHHGFEIGLLFFIPLQRKVPYSENISRVGR